MEHLHQALALANAHNAQLQNGLAEVKAHAWTLQMVCAAMLEKLTEHGSIILTLEERQKALEAGWGIETEVLDDEAKPMIVRVMKSEGELMEFKHESGRQVPPFPPGGVALENSP